MKLATAKGVSERITFRGYVSDAELGTLYGRASVFAFLSEYEGFGMTPLEALAAGVPAVVGDTPVAREVYRSAARYVPVQTLATDAPCPGRKNLFCSGPVLCDSIQRH